MNKVYFLRSISFIFIKFFIDLFVKRSLPKAFALAFETNQLIAAAVGSIIARGEIQCFERFRYSILFLQFSLIFLRTPLITTHPTIKTDQLKCNYVI